jgi:hypothetical protein
MSPLYGGCASYNKKGSFKIPSGSETGKPTLCKERKGWATLISRQPQRVRHPPLPVLAAWSIAAFESSANLFCSKRESG